MNRLLVPLIVFTLLLVGQITEAKDDDRVAAENVLKSGGGLDLLIDGQRVSIQKGGVLPNQNFRVERIDFRDISKVDDEDMRRLPILGELRELILMKTSISDETFQHLNKFTKLVELNIAGTTVNGFGFRHLKMNDSIEILLCGGCPIADSSLVHLKPCDNLSVLGLNTTKVTDAGLEHLREIPSLKELRLIETQVTDKGIQRLTKLSGLEKLFVDRSKVTQAGLKTFTKEMPTCVVHLGNEAANKSDAKRPANLPPHTVTAGHKRNRFEPPAGKVIVFVGNHKKQSFDSYRKVIEPQPTGLKFLWGFDKHDGHFKYQCGTAGDNSPLLINLCFVGASSDGNHRHSPNEIPHILSGDKDDGINNLGRCFKESGRPIFVMLGNEFNLYQTYSPDEYIKAWRYVHDRWESMGATNVAYVFSSCPHITEKPYESYYPGDNYVDWVSTSFYGMHSNKILSKVMGGNPEPGYQQITALAKRHKKPFMLGEAGPFAGPVQSWKDWYEPFFGFVNSHGAKAFTFNNQPVLSPEGARFGDERMEVMSKDIQHRWSAEMLKPRYLKPDANLFDVLGYKNK